MKIIFKKNKIHWIVRAALLALVLSIVDKAISTHSIQLLDTTYLMFFSAVIVYYCYINKYNLLSEYIYKNRIFLLLLYILIFTTILYTIQRMRSIDTVWKIRLILSWILYHFIGYSIAYVNHGNHIGKFIERCTYLLLITAVYGWIEYYSRNNIFTKYFYVDYVSGKYLFQCVSFFIHPIPFSSIMCIGFWLGLYTFKKNIILMINVIFSPTL